MNTSVSDETTRPRSGAQDTQKDLLERVLARDNLQRAGKRVKANRGAAGVDGLDMAQTGAHLKTAWPAIRDPLRQGQYRPQPVRRITIPKANGGQRKLGIPTVTDRLIQHALLQIMQPLIDPHCSEPSHGFRPGRSSHDAVHNAQRQVQAGCRIVVDVDLERFFGHVSHDILIAKLGRTIADRRIVRLVRVVLDAGIMVEGMVIRQHVGTPQGGPLSPLLANVTLNEVDQALERSGHCFERYADDSNIYVRSHQAGRRVLARLRRLYGRLQLRINETKTTIRSAFGAAFLGYVLWQAPNGEVRFAVAAKAVKAYKRRVKQLTHRHTGRSPLDDIARLRPYVRGWKAYFRLAQTPRVWKQLDSWLRHRLRAIQLKHGGRGATIYRAARTLGARPATAQRAARSAGHWWRGSAIALNSLLTIAWFDRLGAPRLC